MATAAPIRKPKELDSASDEQLAAQFRWEVRRLMDRQEWSQLELAQRLGYSSAGYLSRWLNGRAPIPGPGAERLDVVCRRQSPDAALSLPELTFSELHRRWKAARRTTPAGTTQYDVFLASPMASVSGDGYEQERETALEIVGALEHYCGFEQVFYAGATIEATETFESPTFSLALNTSALRSSRYFMLLALTPPAQPSGVYVEAGMALAMGKPSVYFVREAKHLPWMLQTIGEHRSELLPRVCIEPVDSMRAAVGRIKQHRRALFSRLDDA